MVCHEFARLRIVSLKHASTVDLGVTRVRGR